MKQGDLFAGALPAVPSLSPQRRGEGQGEGPGHPPEPPPPVSEAAPPCELGPEPPPPELTPGLDDAEPEPPPDEAFAPSTPAPEPQPAPRARPVALPRAARPLAPEAAPRPAWRQPVKREVLSVSDLTGRIKGVLEPSFSRVLVRGEVTGFRGPNVRGHLYFAIKDDRAQLEVRIWQSAARALRFKLADGLSVIIEGALNVWEPQGRYSLIVSRIEPEGLGAMALAFEQLKQQLAAEGLFGEKRTRPRRPLPFLPRRVGVVTSLSGAALRDFLKVLHRRNPRVAVLVCDARVQGEDAASDVRRALRWLGRAQVDVIVVTRGGGSAEDLWTFNEERVVRAIFDSPVPVVSAVGHEVDVTLSDLVADVRAPTPSAAAEAVAPVLSELQAGLATVRARLQRALERRLLEARKELDGLAAALGDPRAAVAPQRLLLSELTERMARVLRRVDRDRRAALAELGARLQRAKPQALLAAREQELAGLRRRLAAAGQRTLRDERELLASLRLGLERGSPSPRLARARQALAHHGARLGVLVRSRLERDRASLAAASSKLDVLSPLQVLARGYAIARRADGRVVRRAADVAVGDAIEVRLAGEDALQASVTKVKPGKG